MQKKVYFRRTVHKESWRIIASKVKNMKKKTPGWKVCRDTFNRITARNPKKSDYSDCGRPATITPELRKWLVSQLLILRKKTVCTSNMLARLLASKKKVVVGDSIIRRHLVKAGYKWLPRNKKPKYTKDQRIARAALANKILKFKSNAAMDKDLHFSMDGVVLTVPPQGHIERENFLRSDDHSVWRKPSEGNLPELAGHDVYAKQVPQNRMLPLWGGIGPQGFAIVTFHDNRKIDTDEWVDAVREGKLLKALQATNKKKKGPWSILCDNESFLRAPDSRSAYRSLKLKMWKLPPKSPDMNPVEKYWAWIRKAMRGMDMADLLAKRPALKKMAYKQRLLRLVKSPKAKAVAVKTFHNLRKAAASVADNGGAAAGK